jgi:epoxyqueuosine reductase
VRNVLIAIGNSGDASLVGDVERLLDDASPPVRATAVWALSRLLPHDKLMKLAAERKDDVASVQEEWTAALC